MATPKTAPPARTLQRIRVDKITTGLNVRTDSTADPELVASVKANGVLQPPTVTPGVDDTFQIVIGHRRANAAALAGLTEIDAIVVDAALADAARLVDQITENDQRLQLTDVERANGYKQLELFSVSPADIAKRLGVKRDRVDTILKVAKSEPAATALAEHGITLDQAAAMTDFADDKTAMKELAAAAEAGRFDHTLQDVRRKAAVRTKRAELHAELEKAGYTRLKDANYSHEPADGFDPHAIRNLGKPGTPTEPIEISDIAKEHLGGRLVNEYREEPGFGYGQWPTIQHLIRDDAKSEYPKRDYAQQEIPARELTEEEKAEQLARQQAREADDARKAALAAAAAVRNEWLATVAQRTKLPEYLPLLAYLLTYDSVGQYDEEVNDAVLPLLGLTPPSDDMNPNDVALLVRKHVADNPKLADRVVFAILITSIESTLDTSWRSADILDATYLATLASWGYEISEAEEARIEQGLAAAAAAVAEDDDQPADGDEDDAEEQDEEAAS